MNTVKDNTISELLENIELDSKTSLVKQIYTILWELIVNISLKPGQAMSEKEISDALNDLKSVLHLEATITRQVKALEKEDYEEFFKLDEALHKAFFEMAGVPGVWQVVKKTQSDVYRIRHLKRLLNIRRGNQVVEEHKAIVAAIRSGSPDAAEAALIAHIGSLESEIDQMSSHPEILDFIETLNDSGKRSKRAKIK